MEKTKDELKRTRCEREVEVNSARIFFRASNMRSITSREALRASQVHIRFSNPGKQLGHKSIAPTVKCLQIRVAMEFADRAHVHVHSAI